MDERIDEVVQEIEDEQRLGRVSAVKVFRSMLNQPNLVAISSADGIQEGAISSPLSQSSFYNFTCNLPRPCLDVASIQLLGANIPQAQSNIPNTACVFWYYKLSAYSGQIPNINNLYYNRLLPSTYKQELMDAPTSYGWNRTFKNYKDLATELLKSGTKDLCWYNWNATLGTEHPTDYIPFIPNDVSITLNTQINKFQMKGNNVFNTPTYKDWLNGTTYSAGDQVVADFGTRKASWVSLLSSNHGQTPEDSPTYWKQDYNEIVAPWDADTNYGEGRYVTDGVVLYVSTYPNATQNPSGQYPWSSTQTYSQFQVAINPLNGLFYTYVSQIPRRNHRPDLYPGEWILTAYSAVQLYPEGFIVEYLGNYYVATQSGTGHLPTNNAFWSPVAFWTPVDLEADNVWNRYLVTGYQDPNVLLAQGLEFEYEYNIHNLYEQGQIIIYQGSNYEAVTQNIGTPPLPLWSSTTSYPIGTQISFGEAYYQSILQPNVGNDPSLSPSYWVEIRTEWKVTEASPKSAGLYYLTSVYDMYSADAGLEFFFTFPNQIGGQPYVDVPRRLLNSVLGFTWNGVFSTSNLQPFQLDPFFITYSASSIPQVQFLNRFRPVPIYELLQNWDAEVTYAGGEFVAYNGLPYGSLEDNNVGHIPTDTDWWEQISPNPLALGVGVINDSSALAEVFTADAYACLVYSSIIYIYTSIAGASSLDTSRNTNLLAITPMNAGNLGVSFSNQFVDNPLNKVAGDIYTVYIELRDEFGEPYFLSNNAVASFMLKVRYLEENLPRQNT
jgi:hypothetical protein